MKNNPHTGFWPIALGARLMLGLWLALTLPPVPGHADVYENLKQEQQGYKLPAYLPGYGSGPQNALRKTIRIPRQQTVTGDRAGRPFYPGAPPALPGPGQSVLTNSQSPDQELIRSLASGDYTLTDLEPLLLARNAGIASARLKVETARDGYSQVSELNDILLQYSAFTEGLRTGVGPQKGTPMPNTRFPFPNTLQLKSEAVAADVRIARSNLEILKRDIVTRLRTVYWEYIHRHRAGRITEKVIELLDHLRQVALGKYQAGQTTYYDVVRVDTRLALLDNQLETLNRERSDQEQALLALLNLPGQTRIAPPRNLTFPSGLPPFPEVARLALESRQELGRIRARIHRMILMVQAAETMVLPGYSLNFSAFEDRAVVQAGPGAAPGFETQTRAARGHGTPLAPFSALSNAWLSQLKKEIAAAEAALAQEEFNTTTRAKTAWVGLDRAIREKEVYENQILGLSRSSLDVALRGYESGEISFPGISDAYTQWLEVNLALVRKRTRTGIFDARLDQATGMSQTRAGLTGPRTGRQTGKAAATPNKEDKHQK